MLIHPDKERIQSVNGLKNTSLEPAKIANAKAKQVATPDLIAEIQGNENCSFNDSANNAMMAKNRDPTNIHKYAPILHQSNPFAQNPLPSQNSHDDAQPNVAFG